MTPSLSEFKECVLDMCLVLDSLVISRKLGIDDLYVCLPSCNIL